MARRLMPARPLSRVSSTEDCDGSPKCYCSTFVPGSQQAIPQYMASAYGGGDIRIHDTSALTLSASDGISAAHLTSFWPGAAPIVQLNTMTADSDMLLLALDHYGNVLGLGLKDVLAGTRDEDRHAHPRLLFRLACDVCPSSVNCFTVDRVNRRIFTGGVDGNWLCWDADRFPSGQEMMPHQIYQAHQGGITHGDYCQGMVASASEDGSVCVWDVRSQSCICAFDPATGRHLPLNQKQRMDRCSNEASLSVCFDKTGRRVIASSRQKRITVWNIRADASQCSFRTDAIPYALDTAADAIFFTSADDRVWRYSMSNAHMQCYQTSTYEIHDIHIDRELQQTMVVSGDADTVELLSLNGTSLGKATGRKEMLVPESHPIFIPEQFPWSPVTFSDDEETGRRYLTTDPYTPGIEDMCELFSEMGTDDEEEIGELYEEDQGSSAFEYSQANDDMPFSSEEDDDEEMHSVEGENEPAHDFFFQPFGAIQMDGQALEAYGFTSDSDVSPREDFAMPTVQEYSNCDFSSSQGDSGGSSDEEEDDE